MDINVIDENINMYIFVTKTQPCKHGSYWWTMQLEM